MANWDHKSNIGLHPAMSPDPAIRLPALYDGANRRAIAALADIERIRREADRLGIDLQR